MFIQETPVAFIGTSLQIIKYEVLFVKLGSSEQMGLLPLY